jgi:hypothetical protein
MANRGARHSERSEESLFPSPHQAYVAPSFTGGILLFTRRDPSPHLFFISPSLSGIEGRCVRPGRFSGTPRPSRRRAQANEARSHK